MSFIQKIFGDDIDESVHKQFVRFCKGTYSNRAVYEITRGKITKFKSTFEFCNELVELIANNAKGLVGVNGVVFTNKDVESEFKSWLVETKKRMGVYTYVIQFEMNAQEFSEFVKKYSDYYLLLSIETEGMTLRCKTKLSKPGSAKEDLEETKVNFCVASFSEFNLLEGYFFDVKENFKKLVCSHDFIINELIVPDEYKNDFTKARFYAKRKGRIVRHLDIDGRKEVVEHSLLV